MNLKDQTRAKGILERMQETGRIPGSVLIFGPSGVGKTVASLDLAKGILCNRSVPWGCGECISCKHMDHVISLILGDDWEEISVYSEEGGRKTFLYLMGDHPDFIFLPPHGASIRIDQIRAVREFSYTKPALSRGKVVVIDRADLMTRESANALLKVLEEPPAKTHFLLTAESPGNLPPTILSRTHQVEFVPLDRETFGELTGSPDLYELSGGSVTKAKILRERTDLISMVEDFLSLEPLRVYQTAKKVDDMDTAGKDLFFQLLEDRVYGMFREGRIGYDDLDAIMRRILEIREGIPRGLRVDLALFSIYALMEV
ncbi:MAG: AAA family ATPase [Aquificota bacterium]|nr:AAA family ATPase [Aquificota bacterium]